MSLLWVKFINYCTPYIMIASNKELYLFWRTLSSTACQLIYAIVYMKEVQYDFAGQCSGEQRLGVGQLWNTVDAKHHLKQYK